MCGRARGMVRDGMRTVPRQGGWWQTCGVPLLSLWRVFNGWPRGVINLQMPRNLTYRICARRGPGVSNGKQNPEHVQRLWSKDQRRNEITRIVCRSCVLNMITRVASRIIFIKYHDRQTVATSSV